MAPPVFVELNTKGEVCPTGRTMSYGHNHVILSEAKNLKDPSSLRSSG